MVNITTIQEIEQIDDIFKAGTAIVFKHSTRCPISARAKSEFDNFVNGYTGDASLYVIDVIQNRDISQEFEKRSGIRHESPQVVVLVAGKPVWNESHLRISMNSINEKIQ